MYGYHTYQTRQRVCLSVCVYYEDTTPSEPHLWLRRFSRSSLVTSQDTNFLSTRRASLRRLMWVNMRVCARPIKHGGAEGSRCWVEIKSRRGAGWGVWGLKLPDVLHIHTTSQKFGHTFLHCRYIPKTSNARGSWQARNIELMGNNETEEAYR